MSNFGVNSVESYTALLREALRRGKDLKPTGSIEPVLKLEDLRENIETIGSLSQSLGSKSYAAIETAVRSTFYSLLASLSINDEAFGQVWNLFDVVTIISDLEYCEPGLVFWLVEELLDSQTIDGCRTVFDYLDSRRERLTSRHFEKKNLIILRACNELLRRLSRAEDTVFCGRVFIFLFQSFPLGDRSSVNLRGEYHVENVTSYEKVIAKEDSQADNMVIDAKEQVEETLEPAENASAATKDSKSKVATPPPSGQSKSVKFETETKDEKASMPDMDTLYAIFWSMQNYFSQPTKLFETASLRAFKSGLQVTMMKFKEIQEERSARGTSKMPTESKSGVKRKRLNQEDGLASSFNPKYLTSRDLFDLEISDLSFRRHILVQALILIDVLLSLTPKSKKKLEQTTNKSVLYSYILSDDDAKWASDARNDIATYLQQGPEGKFYYRMVDTVLSRDKNWVHWKAESCPPIVRNPISATDFAEAEEGARKVCAPRRMRPNAMGALDLSFLNQDQGLDGMEKFKDSGRFTVPTIESFRGPIMDDDLDIDMAKDEEEKRAAQERRASKLWRALRIASRGKLNVFDHLDNDGNLQPLFEPNIGDAKSRPETMNGIDENSDPVVKDDGQTLGGQQSLEISDQNVEPRIVVE